MTEPDITPKQKEVLEKLSDTRPSIAEKLNISPRAVRYRMNKLEEKGFKFERDSEGEWSVVHSPINDGEEIRNDTDPWRVNSYDKAQQTKEIHNTLTELEEEIKLALSNTDPVVSEYERNEGNATLVLPHSDSHVGAIIEERYGVDFYSAEEAKEVIEEYFDRCIQSARERGGVEDVVLILNGDHLDGEGVYAAQRHEQEDTLRDQQKKAGRCYIEQILKLSKEFEQVWVYCVPGNHGNISKRSTTNADMMLFDFVETALDYSPVENVNMEKAGAGGFINFDVRGWDYHARHGQDFLEHVGTSSGKNRVKDKYMTYDGFDVLLRSHYHKIKYETIGDEVPIVMTGSPAPPSTFAESQGEDGGCCAVHWFTTDEAVIEDFQPMRFKDNIRPKKKQ